MHVKQSSSWKEVNGIYVKQSGTWKTVAEAYVKNGGTWEKFFPASVVASGGSISNVGSDIIHTFTSDGYFTVNKACTVRVLLVGAGGHKDGWSKDRCGLGGGEVVEISSLSVTAAGSYPVQVGVPGLYNSNYTHSTFYGQTARTAEAYVPNGSGGDSGNENAGALLNGTTGGGGGGAGAAATDEDGGAGVNSTITGSTIGYGGGGAGRTDSYPYYGVASHGATGGAYPAVRANSGAGGYGGILGEVGCASADGIVIIRYDPDQ
jgi:hypothetical protein